MSSRETAMIIDTEILAPGDDRLPANLDTRVAAEIIGQATHMIATISRYRRAGPSPVREGEHTADLSTVSVAPRDLRSHRNEPR